MYRIAIVTAAVAAFSFSCANRCGETRAPATASASHVASAPTPADDRGIDFPIASLAPHVHAPVPPPTIPGRLFLPDLARGPAPAMIIVVSSGCVVEAREPAYARELARRGIAGLVVDSCTPRGVRSTVDDQSRMTGWEVENDAWAALIALAKDPRIDRRRIGVMGVSKGGGVALDTAFIARRRWQGARVPSDLAFAAHVPVVPGCGVHQRDARTTGAPIFFMLGGADDYTPAPACIRVADELRAAGNARVEVKVYEGAHHGWERIGDAPLLVANAENYSRCLGFVEDDGSVTVEGDAGPRIYPGQYLAWAKAHCMYRGNTHVGGGSPEIVTRARADLAAFLERALGVSGTDASHTGSEAARAH
jgi:dienelactone hydrolase